MGSNQNKIRGRIGFVNRTSYAKFIKQYPKSEITYNEYISVLKDSNNYIRETILTNPLGFKLPLNLGYIAVNKFKTDEKYFAVDWPATLRLGRRIPLLNLHSFGHGFKINFYKNNSIRPLELYSMDAHRHIKRMLAKSVKEGKQQYISIEKGYFNKRFQIEKQFKAKTT